MQDNRFYTLLTYAGALPFIACAALPLFGSDTLAGVGRYDWIAQVYGLAIVSFVAGSHWGAYLHKREHCRSNLFVSSNVIVLVAFFAFVLTSTVITVLVLMLAFACLLYIDLGLRRAGVNSDDYYSTRLRVTLIVLVSLAVILVQAAPAIE
ncbi:MAG: DUF3429 domain-containing protein [Pseudomonadota bacterium]